ncbi:MAG: hypothetical protein D6834_01590 [Aquificota bacterium]|nr:MAG: hypothetical protein D6834_01590 [Aquificota bacterium]
MKKVLTVAGLSLALSFNSFATTKAEAAKKISEYLKGSNHVSKIVVCENDKYYIGEAILEGYENLGNFVRKVYVSKKDGTILPTMSMHNDNCYMTKK